MYCNISHILHFSLAKVIAILNITKHFANYFSNNLYKSKILLNFDFINKYKRGASLTSVPFGN